MEPYGFIESGILFNIQDKLALDRISFNSRAFSIHGEVFEFILSYYDEYTEFPPKDLLKGRFPDLDDKARNLKLDYCIGEFQKQVLTRQTRDVMKKWGGKLVENPRETVEGIITELQDIELEQGEEVAVYDSGSLDRLEEYQKRKKFRLQRKLLGIETPLKTLNRTGVGFLPGEVISFFARPEVGKTWLAVKIAAMAAKYKHRVLFVSPEIPADDISLRLDVVLGKMEGYNFSHAALVKGESIDESKYEEYLTSSAAKRLIVCDHIEHSGITFSGIQRLVRKHRPEVIVIDGIQLIEDTSAKAESWRMYRFFRGLKAICLANKIVGVITTQAHREADDYFIAPKPSQVFYGDAMLQNSDMAFSMCLVKTDPNERYLLLQKFRKLDWPCNYIIMDWRVNEGIISEKRSGFIEYKKRGKSVSAETN